MSNIYLKVTIAMFQSFDFQGLRNFSQVRFGELQLRQISLSFKTSCCNLKSNVWDQHCVWLLHYFNFERSYDVLKSKKQCVLRTKISTSIKIKRNRKWKISLSFLERRTLCFNSYKNHKLKVKLWWVRARK